MAKGRGSGKSGAAKAAPVAPTRAEEIRSDSAMATRVQAARQQVVFARERLRNVDVRLRSAVGLAQRSAILRERNVANRTVNQSIANMHRLEKQKAGR